MAKQINSLKNGKSQFSKAFVGQNTVFQFSRYPWRSQLLVLWSHDGHWNGPLEKPVKPQMVPYFLDRKSKNTDHIYIGPQKKLICFGMIKQQASKHHLYLSFVDDLLWINMNMNMRNFKTFVPRNIFWRTHVDVLATNRGALLSKDGIFEAQIKLLKEKSHFQIFCDEDFEQGFYPVPLEWSKKDVYPNTCRVVDFDYWTNGVCNTFINIVGSLNIKWRDI